MNLFKSYPLIWLKPIGLLFILTAVVFVFYGSPPNKDSLITLLLSSTIVC